jgi:hypothetical protein
VAVKGDIGGGDARVERCGVERGVTEQDLDHANIDVLLEQMGGTGVAAFSGLRRVVDIIRRVSGDRTTGRRSPALWISNRENAFPDGDRLRAIFKNVWR